MKVEKVDQTFSSSPCGKFKMSSKVVEETVMVEKEKIRCVKICIRQRKMVSREREKYRRQVSLDLNVYKSWIEAKNSAGYTGCSDSAFALHLLSLEYRRR